MLVMLAVPDYMFRKGDTDRIIIPLGITCLGAVVAITCLGSLSYAGWRSADSEIKRELIPSNLHSTYLKRFCIIKLTHLKLYYNCINVRSADAKIKRELEHRIPLYVLCEEFTRLARD